MVEMPRPRRPLRVCAPHSPGTLETVRRCRGPDAWAHSAHRTNLGVSIRAQTGRTEPIWNELAPLCVHTTAGVQTRGRRRAEGPVSGVRGLQGRLWFLSEPYEQPGREWLQRGPQAEGSPGTWVGAENSESPRVRASSGWGGRVTFSLNTHQFKPEEVRKAVTAGPMVATWPSLPGH